MSESKSQIASRTARGGIQAEHDVVDKFNNWRCDEDAKRWLRNMNYDLSTIESVEARNIGGKSEKADVAVSVIVKSLKQGKDRRTREVQAESIAYVVSSYLGIDTSDYSFGYVAGWSSDKKLPELKASLELIRSTADAMIVQLDNAITEAASNEPC